MVWFVVVLAGKLRGGKGVGNDDNDAKHVFFFLSPFFPRSMQIFVLSSIQMRYQIILCALSF